MPVIDSLAKEIARMEGFYRKDKVWANINNNPGNIRPGKLSPRRNGENGGFARYDKIEDGWSDLYDYIKYRAKQGKTLREFIYIYAPPSDNNNTEHYLDYLSTKVGIGKDQRLDSVIQ